MSAKSAAPKQAPPSLNTISASELAQLEPHRLSEFIFANFSLDKILECLRLTREGIARVTAMPALAPPVVTGVPLTKPSPRPSLPPRPPLPPRPTAASIAAARQTYSLGGIGAGVLPMEPCVDCGKPCSTGQCKECEEADELLFGKVQKMAANKNIYLTTARPSKSNDIKFLAYRFGGKGTPKWESKNGKPIGRWMTERQIMGSSFGSSNNVTEQGFVNFFKLNQLYPKTKEGDMPLIRMNPMMFGYVKNYQKQFYPLGKNAFFQGVHKGVTSNLSDSDAKQLSSFGPKSRSCFGSKNNALVPNEWTQAKTSYGNSDVGMIPLNVLGFRGTQGPYTGVTGAAGYPSTGAAAPLPSFGKKRKRWIQTATKRMKRKGTVGTLRRYIQRVYGSGGFTSKGTIKAAILRDLSKNASTPAIAKKATFALNVKSSLKKRSLPSDTERKRGRGEADSKRVQFDAFGRRKKIATQQKKRAKGGRKASYGKKR